MAKQEQSNSQLAVPHAKMVTTRRRPRRTDVTSRTTRCISAATSPRGRPTSRCEARKAHVTTKRRGRS